VFGRRKRGKAKGGHLGKRQLFISKAAERVSEEKEKRRKKAEQTGKEEP
jgi:hypothetical protein